MAALANSAFQYVGSDKWTAVTAWATGASKAAGALVRQNATPTLGNERVFVCIVAGTTHATTEPTWVVTKGAKTTDNTVTWQECTGQPAVNGDATNTKDWNSAKSNTPALGQIIKNIAGTHYFICTTAGTSGSGAEPSWNTTAGVTTTDNTVTWTSLGAVGNFGAFAAPHSRLLNADATNWLTVVPATIYISNSHAEAQSSTLTISNPTTLATPAAPTRYLCVSNTTAPPTALTTGASIGTTGALNTILGGYLYAYGITFSAGSGALAASLQTSATAVSHAIVFENCTLKINTTSISGRFNFGSTSGSSNRDYLMELRNCALVFGATGQQISWGWGNFNIIGGSMAATGSVPTTLSVFLANTIANIRLRACDLSTITGTLVGTFNAACFSSFVGTNCKLGAAVTMTSGANLGPGGPTLKMHSSDNSAALYRISEVSYGGTTQHETTIINTAGASDGTTGVSYKLVSSANTSFPMPLASPEITQWQDTTGSSKTATVEIAGAATLTNADIWLELEYLGSASFPIATVVTSRAADILATPSNVTTSSASWGGSPAVTQKLQVTFTPQMKGPVKVRVCLAKPSTTVYIDPLITIT